MSVGDDMFTLDLFAEMYTPEEALREVAKMTGSISWALLGSDPLDLVLVDVGTEPDEFPKAINKTTRSFGLARMVIGTPPAEQTVFVYVHFLRQGTGAEKVKPNEAMEKVIEAYTTVTVKLNIDSVDKLTPDRVWRMLFNPEQFEEGAGPTRSKGTDSSAWMDDVLEAGESANWLDKLAEKNQSDSRWDESGPEDGDSDVSSEEETTRRYQSIDPALVDQVVSPHGSRRKRKSSIGGFRPGQHVNVFSKKDRCWFEDGMLMVKLKKDDRLDGFELEAGSVKVRYGEGKRFKWLAPAMQDVIRGSGIPSQPKSVVGELYKRTDNFCCFGTWHSRWVELRMGYLSWWASEDEVKDELPPKSIIYLYGMKLESKGTVLSFKTHSMGRKTLRFDATTPEAWKVWDEEFRKHALYAEKMREYLRSEEHRDLQKAWPPSLESLRKGLNVKRESFEVEGFGNRRGSSDSAAGNFGRSVVI